MRIRTATAAATGALALSAFAVPAAQAVETPITYSNVVVNGGKSIVVGTTAVKTVKVTFTVTHTNTLAYAEAELYSGKSSDPTGFMFGDDDATCTDVDATTANCVQTVYADPAELTDSLATTWHIMALAQDSDDNFIGKGGLAPTAVQRASKLTADATPEPVKKGKTITVKGALTRASWSSGKYVGLSGQPVSLQFKASGATAYTTVKTITSGTSGALSTTTTATVDGTYRYTWAGIASTGGTSSAGDAIDVQ
jgi:hypothetical protein